MGFALQLCVLCCPGRLLGPDKVIPMEALNSIGAQLGITGNALLTFAAAVKCGRIFGQVSQELAGWAQKRTQSAFRARFNEINVLLELCGVKPLKINTLLMQHTAAA